MRRNGTKGNEVSIQKCKTNSNKQIFRRYSFLEEDQNNETTNKRKNITYPVEILLVTVTNDSLSYLALSIRITCWMS